MKPSLRSFSKNVLSQVVVQFLLAAKAIILIPIIAKTLGEYYYGIWSQIIITITLLATVLTLRFDTVFVRFFSSETTKVEYSKAFNSMLLAILITLTAVGVCFVAFKAEIAFLIFGEGDFVDYSLVLFGLLSLRAVFLFCLSYFRSRNRIILYSTIQSIQILGEIVLLFVCIIYFKFSLLEILNILLLFNILITFSLIIFVLSKLRINIAGLNYLKPYLLFSLPLIPNVALQWVVNNSNRYVITHLIDLESVGIYSASFALGRVVSFFIAPLAFVLYPMVSKLWEEAKFDETKFWMVNSLKLFLVFAIPVVFGVHYFTPFLLRKLATEQFAQHEWLVFLIGSGFLFVGVYQIYLYVLHLKKQTLAILIIFMIVATLNLTLNFLLVPYMGIEGAAVGTLISYIVQTSAVYILAQKGFPLALPVVFIVKVFFSAALMTAYMYVFTPGSWPKNIALTVSGAGIYFLFMFISGAIGKKEISILKRLMSF
jgi:O-antigen/teichoic acid export membrane protein